MASPPFHDPPRWIGLDTSKANEWIDENVKPIATQVDNFFQVIIDFEQFIQEILDFAITFLLGIKNPLIAIIQAIIDLLKSIVNDLKNAGFYVTYDNAFKAKKLEVGRFEGGYSRFQKELTDKLTNPKDLGRPNFSELTGLLTLTLYASSDLDQIITLVKTVMKFLKMFSLTDINTYPPPVGIQSLYYKTRFGLRLEVTSEELSPTEPPEGMLLKWSLPSAKTTPLFPDINLPPSYFMVTITTRSTPLLLVKERIVTTSSSATGANTLVEPLWLNEDRNLPATSLVLSKIYSFDKTTRNLIGDKLDLTASDIVLDPEGDMSGGKYRIYAVEYLNSPRKIDVRKLADETVSYYVDTSTLGVLLGGSEYSEYFPYSFFPKSLLDVASQATKEVDDLYYISLSSHSGELDDAGDDFLYPGIDENYLICNDDSLKHPAFSTLVQHNRIDTDALRYIDAMREVLTRFALFEKNLHSESLATMSDFYGIDATNLEKIYNFFRTTSKRPLHSTKLTDGDAEDYVSDLKLIVDHALERAIQFGLPTKKEMDNLKDAVSHMIDENISPLAPQKMYYKTLPNVKDEGDLGLYSDLRLGEGFINKRNSRLGYSWVTDAKTLLELLPAEGDTLTFKDNLAKDYPVYIYQEEQGFYPILEDSTPPFYYTQLLLSLPSKKTEQIDSQWIFKRFFDGFPMLEEFLEEVEKYLLAISKALEGIIQALIAYINLIKQRIASLMAFIMRIKKIIDMILALRLPDTNAKYLVTRSQGTLGFVSDLSRAEKQPGSGKNVYSTYVSVVFGSGLPQIVEDLILGFITPEPTVEKI